MAHLILTLILLSFTALVSADVHGIVRTASITAEQWELARDGERIVALEGLGDVVRSWAGTETGLIEIYYPGGEEGELWVNELESWLVSLGVASSYLVTLPGSGKADLMRLRLINDGDRFSE